MYLEKNNEFTSLIRQRLRNIQFQKDANDSNVKVYSTKNDILTKYRLVRKLG